MTTGSFNTWKSVRDEVSRRIAERVWQPGELIPGETELAAEFGCARTTVNRALRDLASDGIVIRRRKGGTRVAERQARRAVFEIPIIRLEIESLGRSYQHVVLEHKRSSLPRLLRTRLEISQAVPFLHVRTLHMADRRPYVYEDRWLNLGIVPEFSAVDLTEISANEWLVGNAPFTHGTLTFSAAAAGKTEAELFETSEGTPLFTAERLTWNGEQPVTHVNMTYPPGYRLLTRI